MSRSCSATGVLAIVAVLACTCYANWSESFDNGKFDLTWTFVSFPQVTGTFKQTITPGEAGDDYLMFTETTAVAQGGSAFAAGFGSDEKFKDVRVRQALNYAVDKQEIINIVLLGYGRVSNGPFVPELWAHNADVAPAGYEIADHGVPRL